LIINLYLVEPLSSGAHLRRYLLICEVQLPRRWNQLASTRLAALDYTPGTCISCLQISHSYTPYFRNNGLVIRLALVILSDFSLFYKTMLILENCFENISS